MANREPFVSIGMPVYNGERFIRQALDSLLTQDFTNFELIISDNASTDGTWEISQQYAARDSRIRLYRNEKNLGTAYNFHRVLKLSSGEYFMWTGHDDLWKPAFIGELVGLLETMPSAVLAMCRAEKIDYNGLTVKSGPLYLSTTGMTRVERLRYSAQHASGWLLHGLYRTEISRPLASVFMDKRFIGASDVLFLHKCIDRGDLVFSEKVLFFKRQSSPGAQDEAEYSTSLSKMLRLLFWYCYGAFFECYHLSGLSPREVELIYWAIIRGLPQRSFFQHSSRPLLRMLRIGRLLFKGLLQ